MDELGTILKETRKARGFEIDQVSQITRIRPRFLEALEEGRYDVLPTPVHVRGFLRNYALFLNLDPDPLIARYRASRRMVVDIPLEKQVRPELGKMPPLPAKVLDDELEADPVFFRPLGNSIQAPAWFSSDIVIGIFVILALAAFIVWAGGRFLIPALSGDNGSETPIAEVAATVPVPTTTRAVVLSPSPVATAISQVPTIPPIASSLQLQLVVLEPSWVAIEVDGQIVQEGLAQTGDEFAWEGTELVKVRTGNGAGLDVTLNEQNLGVLGGRGQMVEKIWGLSGEIPPTPMPSPSPEVTPED